MQDGIKRWILSPALPLSYLEIATCLQRWAHCGRAQRHQLIPGPDPACTEMLSGGLALHRKVE